MPNFKSVIVVICLGPKNQLMEQILEVTDVSLTIQGIIINVALTQGLFKNSDKRRNQLPG